MQISANYCKTYLTILWFISAGILLLIFIVQTTFDVYGERVDEAWGWLLPSILPTLSLITGVLVAEALEKEPQKEERFVSQVIFRLTFTISFAYLLILLITVLLEPLSSLKPVDYLRQSTLWLSPLQGLVTATIGVFFVKQSSS